ncbi:TipAS antibiotic-recognition domain-containing protein [candidate division KSB1 bacterium]|nr:TipAS antibiotic-recognition domain-containing protein [candidate division KSB1 bacterium]
MTHEELYAGLSKEEATAYRKEAIEKWGKKVTQAEESLRKMGKEKFQKLGNDFTANWEKLVSLIDQDPASAPVQAEIAKHYLFIRQFWGTAKSSDPQKEAYIGLGQLYRDDARYTVINGKSSPEFGKFMREAMQYFAENNLKSGCCAPPGALIQKFSPFNRKINISKITR